MLKLENVKKSYGTFTLDCSLEVQPGMITGMIGANGTGKSTTFKSALGLITVDGGTVTIFGKNIRELTAKDKEKIGVVLSDSGFSEYLTVQDVAAVLNRMYTKFSKEEFLEKCRRFGLPDKKKIKEFSTGMRAKLKLLAAISHGAELLILDEPTSGLDVVARDELLELLQDYLDEGGERSVLISSHISGDLAKYCDALYMIHDGSIVLHEEMNVLLDEYGLIKVDETQYQNMEKGHVLRQKKESFGYALLTNQRQFYQKNYPQLVVEKCGIDEVILMMTKGEKIC